MEQQKDKKQKKHSIRNWFKKFFKEEGAKLKDMTFGEKLEYIWEYYKVHIIITALVIFFTVSIIKVVYNNIKYEEIFHCAVVNSIMSGSEEDYIREGFGEYLEIDEEHDLLTFDSSYMFLWDEISYNTSDVTYTSRMKVAAALGARTIDVFVADTTYIESGAPETQFHDLSEVLPADLYAVVEPNIIYAEDENGVSRPFAINISGTHLDKEVFYQEPPCLAIVSNTQHLDAAIEFVKYAFEVEK